MLLSEIILDGKNDHIREVTINRGSTVHVFITNKQSGLSKAIVYNRWRITIKKESSINHDDDTDI